MTAYYNEIDPFAAHVLRALIADGVIAPGDVDERSIVDVQPDDLKGYTQCHFFAGGGLWSVAARMAGWPDDRPLWTGSCPCQPFSVAGAGKGADDERHLWPAFHSLIAECRPATCFGEQVASKLGREWFAGVRADLEDLGYACGGADLCAAGVGAPHKRQRLYWVAMADAVRSGRSGRSEAPERIEERGTVAQRAGGDMADADGVDSSAERLQRSGFDGFQSPDRRDRGSAGNDQLAEVWNDVIWLPDSKGKLRRIKPGLRLLVDGFPGRVGHIRIAGNAIVPQVAATFMRAAQ